MPIGVLGTDSNAPPNQVVGGKSLLDLITDQFDGNTPAFWGRYFKTPGDVSAVQYQAAVETPILRGAGIKLLPYARQTTHVSGSKQQGQNDAIGNVDAFLEALTIAHLSQASSGGEGTVGAAGREYLMFLDVEPEHPLSLNYYIGWATMLIAHSRSASGDQVTLLPCVYMNYSDEGTSDALMSADSDGVSCYGTSVARYFSQQPFDVREWNDARVGPKYETPCYTVLWQYFGDFHHYLDGNQLNPHADLSQFVLDRLCVP